MSVNKAIILGRVGKDVDVRYMPNGNAIANFSVATSEKWKDKTTGQLKEITEWHNVVAFSKLGEIIGQYVNKGDQVYIEGKIRTEQYDKDGVTRYITKIIADKVDFIGSKSKSNDVDNNKEPQQQELFNDFDDDIPF